MSKTVLVVCKLPCGIVLDGTSGENSIELNGCNTALVPGAPGLTHVDETEWLYLKMRYADHAAFKNNSIFTSETDKVADALDMADELKDEKTGLEGIDPNKPGKNLKPQDERKVEEQINQNLGTAPRKNTKGANRAAALEAAQAASK